NPLTGEIVQSHVNMYSGVLKTLSRRIWEQMVDLTIEQRDAAKSAAPIPTPAAEEVIADAPVTNKELERARGALKEQGFETSMAINAKLRQAAKIKNLSERIQNIGPMIHERMQQRLQLRRNNEVRVQPEAGSFEEKALKYQNRMNRWAENNAYGKEFFPIA